MFPSGAAVARYRTPGHGRRQSVPPDRRCDRRIVISDGVIHHTEDPHAALAENLRILKPGGQLYLGVYKPFGRYPRLYAFPGRQIRSGLERSWAKPLVICFAQVPYFLFHFVRSRGERTWNGACNLFYDYFVTPTCVISLSRCHRDLVYGAGCQRRPVRRESSQQCAFVSGAEKIDHGATSRRSKKLSRQYSGKLRRGFFE